MSNFIPILIPVLFLVLMAFAVRWIWQWGLPQSEALAGNKKELEALRSSQATLTFVAVLVVAGICWLLVQILN